MKALDRGQTPTITPDLTDELFVVQVDADGVARDGRASIGTLLEATASSQYVPGANWATAVDGNRWNVGPRSTVTTIPVAAFRPTKTDTVMAVDIMPNGAPSSGPGGFAWLDICDVDCRDNLDPTHVARYCVKSDSVRLMSLAYGLTALPLRMEVRGTDDSSPTGYLQITDATGLTELTGKMRVHPTTPADYGATLNVGVSSSAGTCLVIQGTTSQSGNLMAAKNSSSVALWAITADGRTATPALLDPVNGDQLVTLVGGSAKCVTLGSAALTGITGNRVIAIPNAVSVPSGNATGGGVLYAEAGALKWRGSSGTITTLGAA